MNRKVQLHAVVRHDSYSHEASIVDSITVVAVLPTKAEATEEVDRLNRLEATSSARRGRPVTSLYFWTPTKYYPDGRSAGRAAT